MILPIATDAQQSRAIPCRRVYSITCDVNLTTLAGSPPSSPCVTCSYRETGVCAEVFAPLASAPRAGGDHPYSAVVKAGKQMVVRGRPSDDVFVLCAGWAFRYIQLSDGSRQILKFLQPGDLFSPISIFEEVAHFSVAALTSVQISGFARSEVRRRCFADAEAQSAIAKSVAFDARDADEFLAVLARCSAERRIAHLLLRLIRGIAARHVVREQRYPFPLRQQHIADAVGLTPVHVSRVLSLLRDRGIVVLTDGVLEVIDHSMLERIGSLE